MSWLDAPHPVPCCDRPECHAVFTITTKAVSTHGHVRKQVAVAAESVGWQLAAHADVLIDFCPSHVDLTRPVQVTRLYTEDGRVMPYRGFMGGGRR